MAVSKHLDGDDIQYADRLVVRAQRCVELVAVGDILWAEASGNYVRLHLGSDTVRVRSTFESILSRLDPNTFLRIHRSIVINADHLRRVTASNGSDAMVVLSDGTRLNLSRSHRADVDRYLERLAG